MKVNYNDMNTIEKIKRKIKIKNLKAVNLHFLGRFTAFLF